MGIGEFAQLAIRHIIPTEDGLGFQELLPRNGDQHSLLGLGKQDFPGGQALILKGHRIQVQAHPGRSSHFTGGAGNTARAEVGKRANTAGVAQYRDG